MDRLSGDRQEIIKKCSSDRLRSKLVEAGYDSATVSKLDRTGLMEAVAQWMIKQSVSGLDSDATTQGDITSEIRFRELALKEKRIEAEQEQRRELRKMELELKTIEEKRLKRQAEYHREQMKLELEIKRLELKRSRAGWYEQREDEGAGHDVEALGHGEREHSIDRRTKHFGDTLHPVLPSMPSEISKLSQFFDTIVKLYQIYQVPDDLRAKLLIPKLSSQYYCANDS